MSPALSGVEYVINALTDNEGKDEVLSSNIR